MDTCWPLATPRRGWRTSCSAHRKMQVPVMNNRMAGRTVKGLLMVGALVMASGCQMLQSMMPAGGEEMPRVREGTLAARPAIETRQESADAAAVSDPAEDVSIETVMDSYKALLPLVEDPRKQVTIRHRLADLEFQRAESSPTHPALPKLWSSRRYHESQFDQAIIMLQRHSPKME